MIYCHGCKRCGKINTVFIFVCFYSHFFYDYKIFEFKIIMPIELIMNFEFLCKNNQKFNKLKTHNNT